CPLAPTGASRRVAAVCGRVRRDRRRDRVDLEAGRVDRGGAVAGVVADRARTDRDRGAVRRRALREVAGGAAAGAADARGAIRGAEACALRATTPAWVAGRVAVIRSCVPRDGRPDAVDLQPRRIDAGIAISGDVADRAGADRDGVAVGGRALREVARAAGARTRHAGGRVGGTEPHGLGPLAPAGGPGNVAAV